MTIVATKEVMNMPRMGRPTDERKCVMFRVRLSDSDIKRLEHCESVTGMNKSEIIRAAIIAFYEKTKGSAPATPDK